MYIYTHIYIYVYEGGFWPRIGREAKTPANMRFNYPTGPGYLRGPRQRDAKLQLD